MARTTTKKKKVTKNKKSSRVPEKNVDIQSLSLIILGVIFAFIIYSDSSKEGFLGGIIKHFMLGGLMGKMALVFPFALMIMGIYVIFKDYSKFKLKIAPFIILFISISALITINDFTVPEGGIVNIFQAIGTMIEKGLDFDIDPNAGAGLIGAIPAVFLIAGFGTTIAKVIIIGIIIAMGFLVTGIAFSSIILGIRDFFADSKEKGKEEIAQLRLARQEELERRMLEEEEEDEDVEEEPEEEVEIPIKTKSSSKVKERNKKFAEIMEQTEIVDSGKQITIHDLDLEEEGETAEEETNPILENLDEDETLEEDVEEVQEEEPVKKEPNKVRVLTNLYTPAPETKPKEEKAPVLNLEHGQVESYEDYVFPPISLLNEGEELNDEYSVKELREIASKLQKTLTNFNVDARVINVTRGPTVTQYEVQPNAGVKVSKILSLSDDIALNLAAKSIRIEAPIPGKSAVGIEVPNKTKETVYLREVLESDAFQEAKSKVSFALGKSIDGEPYVSDIAKMPHLLIAGSTGSGKSVCINSILVSLLYKAKPNEVKLILIDPKMVELGGYNGIPHLLIPVVTDAKKAAGALNWAVQEMVKRYNLFAAKGVRDIRGYNDALTQEGLDDTLPQIVIIVDELADLMMVAPSEVEDAICRLAQMARAAGMHLIIATQRPSVDVVTGIIKANIPSRIAFTVQSQIDSRTILDMGGAEKLLGKGDMLYYPIGEEKPVRVQGTFVTDKEIETIIDFVKDHYKVSYDPDIIEEFEKQNRPPTVTDDSNGNGTKAPDADELLVDAIELAVQMGNASASMIQRKFKVGYARAGRIIDQMEERGIVSGYDGSKPRQTLISKEEWEEMKEAGVDSVKYEEIDEDEYNELLAQQEAEAEEDEEDVEYVEEDEEVEEDSEEYEETDEEEEESSEDDDTEYEEDTEEAEEETEEEVEEEEDDETKNNY